MERTSGLTSRKCMSFSSAVSALLVISIMITSRFASAQVKEEWVARYGSVHPMALSVDAAGNVYVTGYTGYSTNPFNDSAYATIKYDTNGNELWVARYGPANGYNYASALAVDAEGNVYVTGNSEYDYATIKYDANGNELWVARYYGLADSGDWEWPSAIAVDAAGNVYVTGESDYSADPPFDSAYATIKYDTNGNELWVARYNGPANSVDHAITLAVDAEGNVYVTGYSVGSDTSTDYATIKYDTNGNELWLARYNGPANKGDYATALSVDAEGNVYVTGYSDYSGPPYDSAYATIKYDTNGNVLWVARYNGPANSGDYATALAVDAEGNVYVTGWSGGYYDFPTANTIKLVPNSSESGDGGGESGGGGGKCFITTIIN